MNQTLRERLRASRAWIFDLDGTLTVPQHDFDALRNRLGISSDQPILEAIEAATPKRAAFLREEVAAWELELAESARLNPGAAELLETLARLERPVAILTRNLRHIALRTLDVIGLRHHFNDTLVYGRDEAKPKPHPEGVSRLMTLSRSQTGVMLGDYVFDLQAGRGAGCITIHVGPEPVPAWDEWTDLHTSSLQMLLPIFE